MKEKIMNAKKQGQKITPFLWFVDGKAEEAVNFYIALFKKSKIASITRYGDEMPHMKGKVLTVVFELNGQRFMAIDGDAPFKFTEALSLFVNCDTQDEVDFLWDKLSEGGQKGQCGWLKDKYGLSWQIVPSALGKLMTNKDPEKSKRVMQALMKMTKIDIKVLEQACEQG
jgi:predicted 3-demethylubiquinone-9 3-methyltransferase (glyoxalase superfamily)